MSSKKKQVSKALAAATPKTQPAKSGSMFDPGSHEANLVEYMATRIQVAKEASSQACGHVYGDCALATLVLAMEMADIYGVQFDALARSFEEDGPEAGEMVE